MAHFAELNENNIVKQVIVISNDDIKDDNGVEKEEIGIAFCKSLFGENTKWVQTSYNSSFRNRFAGINDFYDEANDVFVAHESPIYLESEIIDAEEVTPTPALEG